MVFASNPLSLAVPDHTFESWLRDSSYLDLLDHRTTQLHRVSSPSPTTAPHCTTTTTPPAPTLTAVAHDSITSIFSSFVTLFSLFTLNPFAKLTNADFSGETPDWARGFVGSPEWYSFPSSAAQARLRVHENVKRFARNYAALVILFFACSLYQMPLALVGLLSCLAIWDVFRFCDDKWLLHRFPGVRQVLIWIAQSAVAVILLFSNVQMALFCSLAVSYAVMIFHASFRKLTSAKPLPPPKPRRR